MKIQANLMSILKYPQFFQRQTNQENLTKTIEPGTLWSRKLNLISLNLPKIRL